MSSTADPSLARDNRITALQHAVTLGTMRGHTAPASDGKVPTTEDIVSEARTFAAFLDGTTAPSA